MKRWKVREGLVARSHRGGLRLVIFWLNVVPLTAASAGLGVAALVLVLCHTGDWCTCDFVSEDVVV